jgi:DNA-binding MarR family transcriptional regulator
MSEGKHSPISPETVHEIECLLREVSNILKRKGREILHHFPVTPPQLNALLWLGKEGDMTIGELSQKMYLACSTMTDLVDRMEKNNLVARVRDGRDRRVVQIHLLERGAEVVKEVLEARRQYLAEVLSHISEEQAVQIQENLAILYNEMKRT